MKLRCALVLAWLTAAAAAQAPALPPFPEFWWIHPSPPAMTALTARGAAINAALDPLDIGFRDWTIHQLRCPLLHADALFEFVAVESHGWRSEFVLVLPADAARAPLVVPLLYGGESHPEGVISLQNVAQFNRLMAAENLHPAAAADWEALAVLYLEMNGEPVTVIDAANLPALRTSLPKRWTPPLPSLAPAPGGGATLAFTAITGTLLQGSAQIMVWEFTFDRQGWLRDLRQPFHQPVVSNDAIN